MKSNNRYKNEIKKYKQEERQKFFKSIPHKLGLHFHWAKSFQVKKIVEKNLLPDTSTITEHIAFVVDNEVVEIIHCQQKLGAILLSNPTIVRIPEGTVKKVGDKWVDNA